MEEKRHSVESQLVGKRRELTTLIDDILASGLTTQRTALISAYNDTLKLLMEKYVSINIYISMIICLYFVLIYILLFSLICKTNRHQIFDKLQVLQELKRDITTLICLKDGSSTNDASNTDSHTSKDLSIITPQDSKLDRWSVSTLNRIKFLLSFISLYFGSLPFYRYSRYLSTSTFI